MINNTPTMHCKNNSKYDNDVLNSDYNEDNIDSNLNNINDEDSNEFEDSLNATALSKNTKVKIMVNKKHIDNKSSNAFMLEKEKDRLYSSKEENASLSSSSAARKIAANYSIKIK